MPPRKAIIRIVCDSAKNVSQINIDRPPVKKGPFGVWPQLKDNEILFRYTRDSSGLLARIDVESNQPIPSDADLLKIVSSYFTEQAGATSNTDNIQARQRLIEWLADGSYVVRWDSTFRVPTGYDPSIFHGRTNSPWKSETDKGLDSSQFTLPQIMSEGFSTAPYEVNPWTRAIRVRNEKPNATGVQDEFYNGFPKAHQRMVICFEALLPSPSGSTPTGLYIGCEVNSGGSFALIGSLACISGQWQLWAVNYENVVGISQNITLLRPNLWNRYALRYDPPWLELWEGTVASSGVVLTQTAKVFLGRLGGKAIPFFANEDNSKDAQQNPIFSEFYIGNMWIYELSKEGSALVDQPTIYNVAMTNANTEYSQALPLGCKRYQLGTQDGSAWRLAFVTGKVAAPTAPYYNSLTGEIYWDENLDPNTAQITLYFASGIAAKVMQILVWM
jgi:hypothetical protein